MNRQPHEPTHECDADHCYIHNRDEPMWRRRWLRKLIGQQPCGECWHLYPTYLHLRWAVLKRDWQMSREPIIPSPFPPWPPALPPDPMHVTHLHISLYRPPERRWHHRLTQAWCWPRRIWTCPLCAHDF